MHHHWRRLAAVVGTAATALLLWAVPAGAHVEPVADTGPAGGFITTAMQVPHGCSGSPTTKLTMKVPDGVEDFKPEPVAGWTLDSTTRKVDPPQTIEGDTITQTLDTVTWTAGAGAALPDDQMQNFWFTAKLPDAKVGTAVVFPTVQTCAQGEVQWIEPTVKGQAEPDHPAPTITLTKAESEDADTTATTSTTSSSDSTSNVLGIVGIVLGAAGLAVGGIALARSRRSADDVDPAP